MVLIRNISFATGISMEFYHLLQGKVFEVNRTITDIAVI